MYLNTCLRVNSDVWIGTLSQNKYNPRRTECRFVAGEWKWMCTWYPTATYRQLMRRDGLGTLLLYSFEYGVLVGGWIRKGTRENGWQMVQLSRFVGLSSILQNLPPSSLRIYNPLTGGYHIFWSSPCLDSTCPLLLCKIHLLLLCYAWNDRWSQISAWCPLVLTVWWVLWEKVLTAACLVMTVLVRQECESKSLSGVSLAYCCQI